MIIKAKNKSDFRFYLFTTEYLSQYMKHLNINGEHVLTVAASGDQAFNATLLGAKSVDMYDINPKTYPYFELKKTAIENLQYEEFLDYMVNTPGSILEHPGVYTKKVRDSLPEKVKEYWDKKYKSGNDEDLLRILEFSKNCFFYNLYGNEESFEELKTKLGKINFNFYNLNLLNAPATLKRTNYYGTILTSNIFSYLRRNISEAEYIRFLKRKVIPMLKQNGTIQYDYIYSMDELRKPIKKSQNFDEYDTYRIKSAFAVSDEKDCVKIYSKK